MQNIKKFDEEILTYLLIFANSYRQVAINKFIVVYLIEILSLTISAMVQGYHVYKEVWNAKVDEELRCH